MKTIESTWFVCKIRYDKTQETGLVKKETEQYVLDALSFTEAEKRFIEEMTPYVSGEFEVVDISRAPFKEVFTSDDTCADKWYKAKIAFITLDERTGKEKRTPFLLLVQAVNIDDARKNVVEGMKGTLGDYVITAVNETKIIDVFMTKE